MPISSDARSDKAVSQLVEHRLQTEPVDLVNHILALATTFKFTLCLAYSSDFAVITQIRSKCVRLSL